jgi:hypothetical protein
VKLALAFEGWCSLRLPTDPDPPDEPRGISGYTFAFAGEPDLDRVLNLQKRDGMHLRAPHREIGVTVRSAQRSDGRHVAALVGAPVDLLGDPIIENRNWTLTLPGFEPIVPFHLRIDGEGVALERTAPLNPADPSQPLWQVAEAALTAQGARGLEYEPATIGDATGIWDPLQLVTDRHAVLRRELAETTDEVQRIALEGRIAELEIALATPTDRRVVGRSFVERFGFFMAGDATVEGSERALGGKLATTSATPALLWRVDFWLGSWDPDLLCLYMKGSLTVPYVTPAD